MTDQRIIRTMRRQSWERAKGEPEATLHTFYGEASQMEELAKAIRKFVDKVENEGLCD